MLAGCGGSQPLIGARGATPQTLATHADRGKSWMLPETKSGDLLYVSSFYSGNVYVYSYPQRKLVGTLTGFISPAGECSDSAGDVFITAYSNISGNGSTIYEYAHGGTSPVATLSDSGDAWGCAIDPATGNLAAANGIDPTNPYGSGNGSVAIYADAQGNPTMYYSSEMSPFGFCGYDDQGNLYLPVSIGPTPHLGLARLAHGSGSIEAINLNHEIYANNADAFLPSVQWDGKSMTVSSVPSDEGHVSGLVSVYRLEITGSDAKVIGTTKLETHNNDHAGQSWIQGKRIFGIYYHRSYGHVAVWRYPRGGNPVDKIGNVPAKSFSTLFGVTISVAPPH
jgi:hypothetical protein